MCWLWPRPTTAHHVAAHQCTFAFTLYLACYWSKPLKAADVSKRTYHSNPCQGQFCTCTFPLPYHTAFLILNVPFHREVSFLKGIKGSFSNFGALWLHANCGIVVARPRPLSLPCVAFDLCLTRNFWRPRILVLANHYLASGSLATRLNTNGSAVMQTHPKPGYPLPDSVRGFRALHPIHLVVPRLFF